MVEFIVSTGLATWFALVTGVATPTTVIDQIDPVVVECDYTSDCAPMPKQATATDLVSMVKRAHQHGVTKYSDVAWFNPDALVTREQAAKMIMVTIDASDAQEWMIKQSEGSCVWTDADQIDASLANYVLRSCTKGILQWGNGVFLPKSYLTDTNMMTIINRIAQYVPAWKSVLDRSIYKVPSNQQLTRGELLKIMYQIYQSTISAVVIDTTPAPKPASIFSGTSYYLHSYNDVVFTGEDMTLSFSATTMSSKICNTGTSSYQDNGIRTISFGSRISTMMYCEDDAIMDMEYTFDRLERANYSVDDTTLTLSESWHTFIWKKQ